MWGIYTSKTREDIVKNDPEGYVLVQSFLPEMITIMTRVDSEFDGTFKLNFDEEILYTHKSKYLLNARLTGSKNTGLIGNDSDNTLIGNAGNNTIDGGEGSDVVQFTGASSEYIIETTGGGIAVKDTKDRDGQDMLLNIETLRFTDQDLTL